MANNNMTYSKCLNFIDPFSRKTLLISQLLLGEGLIGVKVWWCGGVLEYWSIGVLEYWSIGILEYWNIGILEYWRSVRVLFNTTD